MKPSAPTLASVASARDEPRCWIVVASRAMVDAAVAGGFVEVSYGKAGPLERMRPGDGIACYSPRAFDDGGPSLQAFTALGRVADSPLYQVAQDHQPFRRAVDWLGCTPTSVRPLIEHLGFIRDKVHWGAAFRFGYLRVPCADFAFIAAAMECPWPDAARSAACASAGDRPPVGAAVQAVSA